MLFLTGSVALMLLQVLLSVTSISISFLMSTSEFYISKNVRNIINGLQKHK